MFAPEASRKVLVITVSIVDAYTFRSALELISGVVNSSVNFEFTPSGITIHECNESQTKTIRVVFKEGELQRYDYEVRDIYTGELLPSFMVPISIADFIKPIRPDSKREGITFYVYANIGPMSATPDEIIITRQKGFENTQSIHIDSNFVWRSRIADFYNDSFVSKGIKPGAKRSLEEFAAMMKMFKTHKSRVIFIKKSMGMILAEGPNGTPNIVLTDGYEDQDISGYSKESYSPFVSDIIQTIEVDLNTLDLMIKISKICAKGIVRIYMDYGLPLVLASSIGSYGECILSFTNDPL